MKYKDIEKSEKLDQVIKEMKNIFSTVPYGIDHTMKVLENAQTIAKKENIDVSTQKVIELSAVLHDIGSVEALCKYGSMEGHLQEQEGVPIARNILRELNYELSVIERVCYIVGNHHTPERIDGIDFQILWEADLIENMQVMDDIKNKDSLKQYVSQNFKTQAGKALVLYKYS